MKKKFYITTAIDYVNGRPHIGHAFEKVIADALARWAKLNDKKVFFLTGTDENAQKNYQAAKEAKIPTQKFVDQNSKTFTELCKKLNISYDKFIRTTESSHKKKSQEIFKKSIRLSSKIVSIISLPSSEPFDVTLIFALGWRCARAILSIVIKSGCINGSPHPNKIRLSSAGNTSRARRS